MINPSELVTCTLAAMNHPGLLEEFDRLRDTNLSLRGTALDLQIDLACNRLDHDLELFAEFVQEAIVERLSR